MMTINKGHILVKYIYRGVFPGILLYFNSSDIVLLYTDRAPCSLRWVVHESMFFIVHSHL